MKLSLACGGVALAGLIVLASAGPAYRIGVPLGSAFAIVRWSALIALLGSASSLAALLWARRGGRRGAAVIGALGVILGVLTAAVGYGWLRQAQRAPMIHDVTTDLENPPTFEAVVARRASAANSLVRTREIDELQRRHYPDLEPIIIPQPTRMVFDRARLIADNQGWSIVRSDPATGRIEATDTTWWFGFTDDVVIRLTPWGTGTRVDVRSASRDRTGDTGTNARRIRRFLSALQQP